MSFNKYYVPKPKELADLIKTRGLKSMTNRKIDMIIGESVSVQIFEMACELMASGLADVEAIEILSQKFPEYFSAQSN